VVAASHAAHGTRTVPHLGAPARRRTPRVSLAQLRAARRTLGVVVVIELGVLAARLLDLAGFRPTVSLAAMGVLTTNVLVTWLIIAQANRGQRQRRSRAGRTAQAGRPSRTPGR
jgi:hypothetical protein